MQDTGFTPLSGHHTSSASRRKHLAPSPSVTSQTSQASTVSRDSSSLRLPGRPGISPMHTTRADSPPLGDGRILSGVSNVSETDRVHLRGISETSVSTENNGNYTAPMEQTGGHVPARVPDNTRPNVVSPLTPPHGVESSDYLDAGDHQATSSPTSVRRKSNFAEGLDEARR